MFKLLMGSKHPMITAMDDFNFYQKLLMQSVVFPFMQDFSALFKVEQDSTIVDRMVDRNTRLVSATKFPILVKTMGESIIWVGRV